jgi:hypothetical protein
MNTIPQHLVIELLKTQKKHIQSSVSSHVKPGYWIAADMTPNSGVHLFLYSKEPNISDEMRDILSDSKYVIWPSSDFIGSVGQFETINEFINYFRLTENLYIYYRLSGNPEIWKFKIS